MLRLGLAILLTGLAACAADTTPSAPPVSPIPAAAGLPTDEYRTAALEANSWFARPQAGQPARAARAIGELEFLAQNLPNNPRYPNANPRALNQLQIARREARSALGIPANADSNAVVRGLRDASVALAANDRAAAAAALPRATFGAGPEETIRRLGIPPRVPSARPALAALGDMQSR